MVEWPGSTPPRADRCLSCQPMRPFGRRGCDASQKWPCAGVWVDGWMVLVGRGVQRKDRRLEVASCLLCVVCSANPKKFSKNVFSTKIKNKNGNKNKIKIPPQFHHPPTPPQDNLLFLFLPGLHTVVSLAWCCRYNPPAQSPLVVTPHDDPSGGTQYL